ncbi:Na(+)/H(+) antiporter [Penicillium macrosclerotiorum]|uniref:Na(+)/H(+) antiporter n=1 Tax=Penicillium macrosclerotiorum TaxID=303699 RepID=UPI002546BA7F|nr:Na(+)/H(+) antiporter [Penicillium macrosclerotiorum]KAJ5690722.1 Na(+)/H(+) antiporter [Penicillium macrosclerotiorum]
MAWDHLDIDKPHLAYMILGGFTGLFMLCSLFVKEKLYIGEATVATLCGIIFGPHAANLFNPHEWGNVDKITLECSRIVLVVQCFAVGVELPKSYMERHWKSVVLLLVPVMTWGWLVTSLFIWWMVPPLNWLESLVCAACVTATDPVLASSVVGKGKFAKRVPKHLRDILSAESGCNDGMAFPFIYLSFYILRYRPNAGEVSLNWFCVTILYECIFGAIFGFVIGYLARHAIKFAERKGLIDRESFLVFYFVLAVFCAGSGSLLGMDDLLIGFSCGVGFSNDGWFTEKTEESHVSNVIDLLLNLAYFVYFGAIVPWEDFNAPDLGLVPWRLVVIAILVIFFRRIPIMLLLKPIIPDVKTWREALFAGHFGPIGVGAIFAAILARAELETDSTQPLSESELPVAGTSDYYIVRLIWPITTFMVISSILVHGSSIAVFTLGKRINTLTITLSYTQANEEGPSWMNRLPRVQSLAKGSMSFRKADEFDASSEEKLPEYPPGTLPPIGLPGNFLRRVRDEDDESQSVHSATRKSLRQRKRRKRRNDGAGGPISQSAIMPARRTESELGERKEDSEERDTEERGASAPTVELGRLGAEPQLEVYQEGHNMIIEDEEGNVLKTEDTSNLTPEEQARHIEKQRQRLKADQSGEFAEARGKPHEKDEGEEIKQTVDEKVGQPYEKARKRWADWTGFGKDKTKEEPKPKPKPKPEAGEKPKARSAHAYQFGNTIIVEDEDGEVIKKYTIPSNEKTPKPETQAGPSSQAPLRTGLKRMGTWFGMEDEGQSPQDGQKKKPAPRTETDDWATDDGLRFTLAQSQEVDTRGIGQKGRRMTKQEFFQQIKGMDAKTRRDVVQQTDAPAPVKEAAIDDAKKEEKQERRSSVAALATASTGASDAIPEADEDLESESVTDSDISDEDESGDERDIPTPNVASSLAKFTRGSSAHERRSNLSPAPHTRDRRRRDSDDDGTERIPPSRLRQAAGLAAPPRQADDETGETPAERRRRLAALGEIHADDSSDSEDDAAVDSDSDDGEPRQPSSKIQFAETRKPSDQSSPSNDQSSTSASGSGSGNFTRGHRPRVSWGGEKGRDI